MSRPVATLAAAAVGGVGLWLAGHWDTATTGGYWAALGVVAGAGLLMGLAQLRSPDGNAPGMFLVAFLPITVAAGWVLVTEQPNANAARDHVRAWNRDLGIADVVHYVAPWLAVCAFAIGLVLGFTMLAGYAWRRARVTTVEETAATPATNGTYAERRTVVNEPAAVDGDRYAADEPTRAERAEADAEAEAEADAEGTRPRRRVRILGR